MNAPFVTPGKCVEMFSMDVPMSTFVQEQKTNFAQEQKKRLEGVQEKKSSVSSVGMAT